MRRLRSVFYALANLVLVLSCVTEHQPDALRLAPSLIVEGQITDQPGPYTCENNLY
ncbi:hypothetical protein [Spirosoma fluminis]